MSSTYNLELLPGEPILFIEIGSDYSVYRDFPEVQARGREILNAASQPIYMLFDTRELRMTFDDLIHGANVSARGEDSLFHHPNIARIIVISSSSMIKLAVKGMNNDIFGNLKMNVFDTPEEALAYAREQAAISAG
jgi:hypothetical protein